MSENLRPIYRICFKREQQLLSDTAATHKRNLLLFSSTSIGLIIISIISKKSTLTSIFSINFDGSVSINSICAFLLALISYELYMFKLHCEKSKSHFTSLLEHETPDISLTRCNYEEHIEKIEYILSVKLPEHQKSQFKNISDSIEFNNNEYTKKLITFSHQISLMDEILKSIDEKLDLLNFSQEQDVREQLKPKYFRNEVGNLNSNIKAARSYLTFNDKSLKIKSLEILKNMDLILIEDSIKDLCDKTDSMQNSVDRLADAIIEHSTVQTSLEFAEIKIPNYIAFASIILTFFYILLVS